MRKIEKEMLRAFNERKNWSLDNTRVEVFKGELSVYLHGNKIYQIVDGIHFFTLAGWNTNTTRSRLRALGVDVSQRGFAPFYEGNRIADKTWYRV